MQISLWAHPAYESFARLEISAEVERISATLLRLRYLVLGPIAEIVLPPPSLPIRANNLWRTTCFEAFLAREQGTGYFELNFSPSTQWAAYEFAAYRDGMVQAAMPGPPDIEVTRKRDRLELAATVSLDAVAETGRFSVCAVIEERGGNLSYWADRHAGDGPDFHRRDCFELQLPAAKPA